MLRAPAGPLRAARLARRFAAGSLRRLGLRTGPPPILSSGVEPAGADRAGVEVVVYFAEVPAKLYQLRQWLPVLEELDRVHRVLLVLRDTGSYEQLAGATRLPRLYVRRFSDLMARYDDLDAKLCVYVNNGMRNFQSLAARRLVHVLVNHGESDKVSSVSNQAKAYDRVLVAGPAAVERYRRGLMAFDTSSLLAVGRPQLDLDLPPALPPSNRPTLVYAPTWEGEDESNNYTSLDVYGARIVEQLLAVPGVRVVYKPHPRVPRSPNPTVRRVHERVVTRLRAAAAADRAAGHAVLLDGDVLALLPGCDLLVCDVSSVCLDFLYLRTDAPLFLTDRRTDRAGLRVAAPVAAAADVVDASTVTTLAARVADRLARDVLRPQRRRLRAHYFGDLRAGQSTQRFLASVDALIRERDRLADRLIVAGASGEAAQPGEEAPGDADGTHRAAPAQ